ncbi:hypothetical protein [Kribbella sp. VKM Ac-2568]|uniref:hypothetical protein n=1 Tax=Kribbella sp. VKM Ac-2568 TaxID=2512219 RepID=UPI00104E2394|nr:hypothetical protein [Kribbella sp. VKM Ac-2568]
MLAQLVRRELAQLVRRELAQLVCRELVCVAPVERQAWRVVLLWLGAPEPAPAARLLEAARAARLLEVQLLEAGVLAGPRRLVLVLVLPVAVEWSGGTLRLMTPSRLLRRALVRTPLARLQAVVLGSVVRLRPAAQLLAVALVAELRLAVALGPVVGVEPVVRVGLWLRRHRLSGRGISGLVGRVVGGSGSGGGFGRFSGGGIPG